jgi:uncharacterized protein HemX
MRTKSVWETFIICAAIVAVIGILVGNDDHAIKGLVWMLVAVVAGFGVFLGFKYLTSKGQRQLELTGSEQYRQLADEYRRLSDLAITAQEHTDLKLGEVSAQLDHLRGQVDSLQKILAEVE